MGKRCDLKLGHKNKIERGYNCKWIYLEEPLKNGKQW